MTGRMDSSMQETEQIFPFDYNENETYQHSSYVSYSLKTDTNSNRREFTAVYGSMPIRGSSRKSNIPVAPRLSESDALLGSSDQHSNQSETESDSDGSCTISSTSSSLQSILRIPSTGFSCRNLKKQVSVGFALDIHDEDKDQDTKRRLDGSCATRCMPRRLTIEEKAALYQVRPDLELVPTILLLSELEERRRRRQRKLMFSILGASLILLMMIVFYYLVSQM
ncbi:unnamed protein product [Peronospora belbahrii]|uniref:Uncharacterized protein n=1 Tax=Peronospora belbahrii TaxID=622444 RepID=A0AAU9L5T6_9STRA|nr:unnamed protein product [Peronospora belbahrii]CAH0522346.1 unnamed protein product [Peronospora belbahrii]